jgi:hypothetical protein
MKKTFWLSFRYYLVAQIKMIPMNLPLDFSVPSNFPDLTYDISTNPPTEKGFEPKLFYDGRLASDGLVSCGFVTCKKMPLPIMDTP